MNKIENTNINNLGLLNSLSLIINAGEHDSNYAIASYIIHNIERIHELSINELVDETFTSRSAIRRFSERLGYDNYSEMKASINRLIFPSDLRHRKPLDLKNHRDKIKDTVVDLIDDINSMWPNETVNEFVELLHNNKNILLVCANNTSGDLIRFQQELIFANKIIEIISGSYTNNELLNNTNQNYLIITVSASGKFAEIADYWIKSLSGYKILITANRNPILRENYDKLFYLSKGSFSQDKLGMYGKYGITYLFDLISNYYLYRFKNKKN